MVLVLFMLVSALGGGGTAYIVMTALREKGSTRVLPNASRQARKGLPASRTQGEEMTILARLEAYGIRRQYDEGEPHVDGIENFDPETMLERPNVLYYRRGGTCICGQPRYRLKEASAHRDTSYTGQGEIKRNQSLIAEFCLMGKAGAASTCAWLVETPPRVPTGFRHLQGAWTQLRHFQGFLHFLESQDVTALDREINRLELQIAEAKAKREAVRVRLPPVGPPDGRLEPATDDDA